MAASILSVAAVVVFGFICFLFACIRDEVLRSVQLKEENNALRIEIGELRGIIRLQNESLHTSNN